MAFDTSAAHCAVALLIGTRSVAHRFEEMQKGQAERLMPLIDSIMAAEGAVFEELDAIAVGIGPGNFTGIRIAVSAARGLALACDIPAIGVSNFEVMLGGRKPKHPQTPEHLQTIVSLPGRKGWMHQKFAGLQPSDAPTEVSDFFGEPPSGNWHIIGENGPDFAYFWGRDRQGRETAQFTGEDAALPQADIADVIARLGAAKLMAGEIAPRPSPLYVRAADAAPPKALPPTRVP